MLENDLFIIRLMLDAWEELLSGEVVAQLFKQDCKGALSL